MDGAEIRAQMILRASKGKITRQQYKTLQGLILAGNCKGALKGLERIIRKEKHDERDKGQR